MSSYRYEKKETQIINLKNFEVMLANYRKPFQFFNASLIIESFINNDSFFPPFVQYQEIELETCLTNENDQANKLEKIRDRQISLYPSSYGFPREFEVETLGDEDPKKFWLGVKYIIFFEFPNFVFNAPIWNVRFRIDCISSIPIFYGKNSWYLKEKNGKAQLVTTSIHEKVMVPFSSRFSIQGLKNEH